MTTKRSVVLFDLGETLFEPLPRAFGERNLLKFARQANVGESDQSVIESFAKAKSEVAQEFANRMFYLHREFIATAFKRCCQSLGNEGGKVANGYAMAQRDDVIEHLSPRADCFSTLEELNRRGYRLGIVSNIDNDWLRPLIDRWQLSERVNAILSSETARSCKPDERIFQLACAQHDCAPSQAIFIGDDERNDVLGANGVGMTSILLTGAEAQPTSTAANFTIQRLSDALSLEILG